MRLRTHLVGDPERRGALDRAGSADLIEALEENGPLVLTGHTDDVFCSGTDTRFIAEDAEAAMGALFRAVTLIAERPDPVIAAVRGRAVGGGWILAAVCDACFAAPSARFALPEMRMGVPPFLGVAALEAMVPRSAVTQAAALCEEVSAEALGAANAVTLASDPVAEAEAHAARLAEAPPAAWAALKAFTRRHDLLALREAIRASEAYFRDHLNEDPD